MAQGNVQRKPQAKEDRRGVERLGMIEGQCHQIALGQRGRSRGLVPVPPFRPGSEVRPARDPSEAAKAGFARVLSHAGFGVARRLFERRGRVREPVRIPRVDSVDELRPEGLPVLGFELRQRRPERRAGVALDGRGQGGRDVGAFDGTEEEPGPGDGLLELFDGPPAEFHRVRGGGRIGKQDIAALGRRGEEPVPHRAGCDLGIVEPALQGGEEPLPATADERGGEDGVEEGGVVGAAETDEEERLLTTTDLGQDFRPRRQERRRRGLRPGQDAPRWFASSPVEGAQSAMAPASSASTAGEDRARVARSTARSR